jgi:hypothetical protein
LPQTVDPSRQWDVVRYFQTAARYWSRISSLFLLRILSDNEKMGRKNEKKEWMGKRILEEKVRV